MHLLFHLQLCMYSPFVRHLLENSGEEDCVIYLPNVHNTSVRYLLEMLLTGSSSEINKTEIGNLKILLEILGCSPEMGFSIEKMDKNCKKVALKNDDKGDDELNRNLSKPKISKVFMSKGKLNK